MSAQHTVPGLLARWLAAPLVLVIGAITFAACGGSGSSSSSSTTGTGTVAPATWATSICTPQAAYQNQVKSLLSDYQSQLNSASTPAQAQATLNTFFADIANATNSLVSKFEAAGIPSGTGGKAFSQSIISAYQRLATDANNARAAVARLPVNDPSTFNKDVQSIGTSFQNSGNQFGSALHAAGQRASSSPAGQAYLNEPACKAAQQPASP